MKVHTSLLEAAQNNVKPAKVKSVEVSEQPFIKIP